MEHRQATKLFVSSTKFEELEMSTKKNVGFSTPSGGIQDSFDQVVKQISKQKTDWNALKNIFTESAAQAIKLAIESNSKGKPPHSDGIILTSIIMANSFVTKLGAEVTEVHERLAKVEKTLAELKLALAK
jgi:hypothetical protein